MLNIGSFQNFLTLEFLPRAFWRWGRTVLPSVTSFLDRGDKVPVLIESVFPGTFEPPMHLVMALVAEKHEVILVDAHLWIVNVVRSQVNLMMDLGPDSAAHLASSASGRDLHCTRYLPLVASVEPLDGAAVLIFCSL